MRGDTNAADPERTEPFRTSFWGFLADDLSAADRWSLLADFDRALGFGLAEAEDPETAGDAPADPEVAALLAERQAARAAKDFATADRIRDELAAQGYEIVDTAAGPQVRRVPTQA